MQIVDWISTGGWTDHPVCVDPVIQHVAIRLNDNSTDVERQGLLDRVPRMMGTARFDAALDGAMIVAINKFNARFYGENWRDLSQAQLNEFQGPNTEDLFALLDELIEIANKALGRDQYETVDFSGVCAVMAGSPS
jgi:hypothetical protein